MNFNDWIGSVGVAILLIAFVMTLINKISKNTMAYMIMNCIGSALAAIASYMNHYTPFIILELAWMLASVYGMWQILNPKRV